MSDPHPVTHYPPPSLPELPIGEQLQDVRRALTSSTAAILTAPPGSGKTTIVPLALLEEPWLESRRIIMLEPRRLAARMAAQRMASLLGEKLGQRVGYRVRFDAKVTAETRIEVVTEGLLIRRLQSDPELDGVGLVIFDEVHERNLDTDLALALTLDVQSGLRPDLRILAMSATLEAQPIAAVLDPSHRCPIVTGTGREHPVSVHYMESGPARLGRAVNARTVAAATRTALERHQRDVLVFLPGAREIRQVMDLLADVEENTRVLALHGDLPRERQAEALAPSPDGGRRVLLATNIAESSLTIEGIGVVVDSGLARVPRFDPNTGLTRLATEAISKASAEQRRGRAGRLGPGACYRLWSEQAHTALAPARRPEILDADLAAAVLTLAQWGINDPDELRWLDRPPRAALDQARGLLASLQAIDGRGHVTPLGRQMAELPAHPRLARMLVAAAARDAGSLVLACDLAAVVEARDPLRSRHRAGADVTLRIHALERFRAHRELDPGIDRAACAQVERAARQLRRRARQLQAEPVRGSPVRSTEIRNRALGIGALLSLAYPDRIGAARGTRDGRYHLANGRGATLGEQDPLLVEKFIVAVNVDAAGADARVFLAAPIEEAAIRALHGRRISSVEHVAWNAREAAVTATREDRLGALTLTQSPLGNLAQRTDAVSAAMVDGVREMGLDALPWNESSNSLRARIATLRRARPTEGWPDLADAALFATLEDWLAPLLVGMTRRDHLKRLDLVACLRQRLGWPLLPRLDEGAPTHLTIPSGRSVRLRYHPVEPPVLAARLQELFSMTETPRVAWGTLPVMVHLLSPAGRPVQVTQDLPGFWARTYAEVRKELKGRYPKHYWPEDPHTAQPTRGVRPPG